MTDKKKSMLVIDDDKDLCRILKDIFGAKGYEVEAVYNGFVAVELAKKKKFDIVLIDLVMDGKNGIEAMEEIQKLDPDTSCFMMTAYPNDPLFEEGKTNGDLVIFKKPLDFEGLPEIFDKKIAENKKGKNK